MMQVQPSESECDEAAVSAAVDEVNSDLLRSGDHNIDDIDDENPLVSNTRVPGSLIEFGEGGVNAGADADHCEEGGEKEGQEKSAVRELSVGKTMMAMKRTKCTHGLKRTINMMVLMMVLMMKMKEWMEAVLRKAGGGKQRMPVSSEISELSIVMLEL